MTTHHVNQELAKHHYATLMREAQNHRLIRTDAEPDPEAKASRWRRQLTWARRRVAFRAAARPA
jgi:hypothetical protein